MHVLCIFSLNAYFYLSQVYKDHMNFFSLYCIIYQSFIILSLLYHFLCHLLIFLFILSSILLYNLLIFIILNFVVSPWNFVIHFSIKAISKNIYTFLYVIPPYLFMIFWLFIFPSVKL